MIVRDQNPGPHRTTRRVTVALLRYGLLVIAMLVALPQAPVYAAEQRQLALTGPANAEALGSHFEYTMDADWQMKVGDFVGPNPVAMRPLPGPVPDFGYTAAKIWLRLKVVNETARVNDWRFFVHANFTQQIAIYKVASDGAVATLLDLTEDTPFSARPINNPQMVAPFELAPGEAATLIVAYYSQGASRLSMSVETQDSFAARTGVSEAKSYAFYGMMLVMIALAVVALAALRLPVFAAYAGYLLSVFVYVAHADGMAFQYIWPDFPRFNSMASVVAGSGVMVFGGLFAMTILRTAQYHRIMHRMLLAVVVLVLATDVILWSADPQLLKRLLVLMILVSTLTFVTAGLVAARTRFREVRFYVFAWAAALIPASLFTARYAFGFEPTFITTYDAVRLALLFDAMMMGLALFDSYNHQRRTAMEETLAHAQRNVALGQRLALLEQSHQEVSASAREREESMKDTVHDLRQPMQALRLSFRQMFGADAGKAIDAGQVESALAYMERLVAERLADRPGTSETVSLPADDRHDGNVNDKRTQEPGLHAVLRGIADMFKSEAADKGLDLKLVLAAPDAEVAAYPLMRAVANLVSNAIKYTRAGRVVIGLRRSGASHRIEVHDTGPGLSGEAFEQALVRSQRLDRDRSVAEGSGLGLAVAREIVAANDWTITSCAGRRTGASLCIDLRGTSETMKGGHDTAAVE